MRAYTSVPSKVQNFETVPIFFGGGSTECNHKHEEYGSKCAVMSSILKKNNSANIFLMFWLSVEKFTSM